MWRYLQQHEAYVRGVLAGKTEAPLDGLGELHGRQLAYMQHERLIHLLVTLFVALFALGALLFAAERPGVASAALALLLVVLLGAYVLHYFRLENGVQRWYHLANQIEARRGRVAPSYAKTVR